jgi:hypothetical protein
MQIRRFAVKGFRNLTREIVLEDLHRINVLHGENSIGKSNVLQAIQLFFSCLRTYRVVQSSRSWVFPEASLGEPPLFNLERPSSIEMEASLLLSAEELVRLQTLDRGVPDAAREIEVAFRLHPGAEVRCEFIKLLQGDQALPEDLPPPEWLFLALPANLSTGEPSRTMELVGLQRAAAFEGKSDTLALRMFDARESPDIVRATRWKTFVKVMKRFEAVTGPGDFVITYQRQEQLARLFFDDGRKRVPFDRMGSGVQQLVALLGSLLMNKASIVAIEEPELNLRFTVQALLREVLRELIGTPGAPDQLFLTSHSPAFESGDNFYAMLPSPDGPEIKKYPASEAHLFTSHSAEIPPDSNAPLSYVTSEGLVKIPGFVREKIRLSQGGGVVFHVPEHRRHAELRTTEQFLAEFHGDQLESS